MSQTKHLLAASIVLISLGLSRSNDSSNKTCSDKASVRLTSLSHGGGCGCKIAPAKLTEILSATSRAMPILPKELLVGLESSDDAAVYKINEEQAIVATHRFFYAHSRRSLRLWPDCCHKCDFRHLCYGRSPNYGDGNRRHANQGLTHYMKQNI